MSKVDYMSKVLSGQKSKVKSQRWEIMGQESKIKGHVLDVIGQVSKGIEVTDYVLKIKYFKDERL